MMGRLFNPNLMHAKPKIFLSGGPLMAARRVIRLGLGAVLLAVLPVTEAEVFEGSFKASTTLPDNKEVITIYTVRGQSFKGDDDTVVADDTERYGYIYSDSEQRSYYINYSRQIYSYAHEPDRWYFTFPGHRLFYSDLVAKATDRERILSGYRCRQYLFKTTTSEIEVWATDQIGAMPLDWMTSLAKYGIKGAFFPLAITTKEQNGEIIAHTLITNIKPGPVPNGNFKPPADFVKADPKSIYSEDAKPVSQLKESAKPTAGEDQPPADFKEATQPGSNSTETVTPAAEEDRPPRPIHRVLPTYPEELRKKGKTAKVMLEFVVNEDGTVSDVKVISTGHSKKFSQAAMEVVKQWKFEPAVRDGKPVKTKMRAPILFK